MSRTERLLDLIQCLRRHRAPVTGAVLAAEFGVSIRTLYRDIATLQAQGADIQGEPGLGYVLRPGFMLPPLMFSAEEIEALVLGSRWVASRADDARLGLAAGNALSKISAVLPPELRESVHAATLIIVPGEILANVVDISTIRVAIRNEHKLAIAYRNADGSATERTIWPIALAFFEKVRIIAAWCELRQAYRNFRVDRIGSMEVTGMPYPRRRVAMLKEWRERERISAT
jgi:predicted DNA-binding transcriptional regulator YafY